MIIGVDIDGVLADQIAGVIPRIKRRLGVELRYEEITHFRLPIGETDIAVEILDAMADPEYLLSMPVHDGARRFLSDAGRDHEVKLITARPEHAIEPTREWLARNELPFDELVFAREARKSLHGTDFLVDDYIGNIREFLEYSGGHAVLLSQPWNQDLRPLNPWLASGRLDVAMSLSQVLAMLPAATPF